MIDEATTKVIYVDFKTKHRVPTRTGYKVIDHTVIDHTFDAMTYFWPGYEHYVKSVKQENLCRISQLNKLIDSFSGGEWMLPKPPEDK